jgi:hypothetical protein
MDAERRVANAIPSLVGLLRSSFPPLDPNGQPFSMILRGAAAELGDLRCILSAHPNAGELLQMLDQAKGEDCDANKFDDIEDTEGTETLAGQRGGLLGRHEMNPQHQAGTTACTMSGRSAVESSDGKKRGRDYKEDEGGSDDDDENGDDEIVYQEHLLLYVPSVTCTCSSWRMKNVSGKMLVTSLRVFFLPYNQNDDSILSSDDIAIDGRCIALHAVDSVPLSDNDILIDERERPHHHHVYCQLVELTVDEDDTDYTSTISMFTPIKVVDDKNITNSDAENDEEVDEEDSNSDADGDGTIEVYFRPGVSNPGGENVEGSQCNLICEIMFKALTKLASLNPAGECDDGANGGGGFFNMLSLMAGMGRGFGDGFDGETVIADHGGDGDDDMVVRLGGSNNFVENDDESDVATDTERQAMLRRLDDMLVVPPEYEIASSNDDGQFDDADNDDEADADDDEIL